MLNALWFVLKIGVLVGAALWIAEHPGEVTIEWMGYTYGVQIGLFLVSLLGLLLFSILIYATLRSVKNFPARYRYARAIKKRDKGMALITRGLSAIAAGDVKEAKMLTQKAEKQWHNLDAKNDNLAGRELVHLLHAQTARLEGDNESARHHFKKLSEHDTTAFIGLRGLLQDAVARGKNEEAARIITDALAQYPKTPWLLRTGYDIQARRSHWEEARMLLKKAEKISAVNKEKAACDRAAMILAEVQSQKNSGFGAASLANGKNTQLKDHIARLRKASKIAPDFIPVITELVRLYLDGGQRRQAIVLIEKTWQKLPHPDLVPLWQESLAPSKQGKLDERMAWIEKLVVLNPHAKAAHLAAGKICLENGLWGEARSYLESALSIAPDKTIYEALARLEKLSGHGETEAQKWRDLSANASQQECWYCNETGQVFDHWYPFADSQAQFNSIVWGYPKANRHAVNDALLNIASL